MPENADEGYNKYLKEQGQDRIYWSYCPFCGVKYIGRRECYFRGEKWHRICEDHGRQYRSKTNARVWAIQRRWIGFNEEIGEWEEDNWECDWGFDAREILKKYRAVKKEALDDKGDYNNCFWEYRLARSTKEVHTYHFKPEHIIITLPNSPDYGIL